MKLFLAVKFAMGYENNMGFLVTPKPPKCLKVGKIKSNCAPLRQSVAK